MHQIGRRLIGGGNPFIGLAQSLGAKAYWPLDQASGFSTTNDSVPDVWGFTTGTGGNHLQAGGTVYYITYQDLRVCNYTDNPSARFQNNSGFPYFLLGYITSGITSATSASFIIWVKMINSSGGNSWNAAQWGQTNWLLGTGGGPFPGTAYDSTKTPDDYLRLYSWNTALNDLYLTGSTSPAVDTSDIFMMTYTQEDKGGGVWDWRIWISDSANGTRNLYSRTGNSDRVLTPHSGTTNVAYTHQVSGAGFWAGGAMWFDQLLGSADIASLYALGKV